MIRFEIPAVKIEVGARVGRLLLIERISGGHDSLWRCRCECGVVCERVGSGLKRGRASTSCGCARLHARRAPPKAVAGAAWIPLSRGAFALVDEADAPALLRFTWSAMLRNGRPVYASARIGGPRAVPMHRAILGARAGEHVDHINGDGLDNRRANLRRATRSQNAANKRKARSPATSRFKGVSWNTSYGKWYAQISSGGRTIGLGRFALEVDAARAYDAAARRIFGEFAVLNFAEGV